MSESFKDLKLHDLLQQVQFQQIKIQNYDVKFVIVFYTGVAVELHCSHLIRIK